MSSNKIAVLPEDSVGNDVMGACLMVLKAMKFEAEYPRGYRLEFWRHEGNSLPDRTLELLRSTDAYLFGRLSLYRLRMMGMSSAGTIA